VQHPAPLREVQPGEGRITGQNIRYLRSVVDLKKEPAEASAFANTKGGAIVLGVFDDGKQIAINGLSDEFRAVQITRKAIDLLLPTPAVSYDYVDHVGKQLFVIEVPKSSAEVSLGGKAYLRTGDRTTPKQTTPVKPLTEPGIEKLRKALADDRRIDEIEKILQIRHLYTHQNGIVDDKFRRYFPATKVNDEYPMTLEEFLKSFEYLASAIEAVDDEARKVFNLSLYS